MRRLVLVAVALVAVLVSPANASAAAANPYTSEQVCGSGHLVVDQAELVAGGVRHGEVFLLYSPGTGRHCLVTLKYRDLGVPTRMSLYLELQGRPRGVEHFSGAYYAGPVKFPRPDRCFRWGGAIGSVSYISPWQC